MIIGELLESEFLAIKYGQAGKSSESNECANHTEKDDILDVSEELLSVHVESGGKHDGRKDEVEEKVIVEAHQIVEFRSSLPLRIC